ncbi:MAG: DUF885 domain-containing protein, partial [Deltaproteobacteria bacterium]|nr:DUF885 domain-containing protein [Deltaproteobacteria bacterium]
MSRSHRLLIIIPLVLACGGGGSSSSGVGKKTHVDRVRPAGLSAEGGVGVGDAGLAELLVDHWDWVLRSSPVWATTMGDHRFDRQLADNSQMGIQATRAKRRIFLTRAKQMSGKGLS